MRLPKLAAFFAFVLAVSLVTAVLTFAVVLLTQAIAAA